MIINPKRLYATAAQRVGVYKISDSDLKKLQSVQLDILDDLIQVCKKENLTIILQAGTLIGAALYKGFIPWDDDIDLFMTRKEYDHLLEVFPKEFSHKYIVQTPKTEPSATFGFMKIRKRDTSFVEVETFGFPMHKGIFIDVCPLENAPDSRIKQIIHGVGCFVLKQITTACALFRYRSTHMMVFRKHSIKLHAFMLIREIIGFFFSFLSVGKWNRITEAYCAKYKNRDAKYFVVPYSQDGYFKELYPKRLFLDTVLLEFEGRKLPAPATYDSILRMKYGDYTIIPPPEKRTQHWIAGIDFGD